MKLNDKDLDDLAAIFNGNLKSGLIQDEWLHSYLVPIPKPGKNHTKIQGYHIITMQNTVGKLIKKIVAKKLTCFLENNKLLPSTLGGYRPNREMWANAAVFVKDVYEGFHDGIDTCAAIIDSEDVYNSFVRVSHG